MIKEALIAMVCGVIGALAFSVFDKFYAPSPRYAKVDLVSIIEPEIKRLAERTDKSRNQAESERLGGIVQRVIDEISTNEGWTILNSQAVVAGDIPDLTARVQRRVDELK